MTTQTVKVPRRFCGPQNSGNGGYTCALVARALGGTAEVTLRKPVPIETEMRLISEDGRSARLLSGDELIAEGVAADWPLETPPSISFAEAEAAAKRSHAFHEHPFPTCFVCGPERDTGDGLRIFPGEFIERGSGRKILAAAWAPDASLPNQGGVLEDTMIWSALDCPTGFAGGFPELGTLVTGRLAVKPVAPARVGEKCVLAAWSTGIEGRKHFARAVLIGGDGSLRAQAKAVWVKL